MYDDMDDAALMELIWSETQNPEEFLARINDERSYIYEESKIYLRQMMEGVNHE